MPNCKALYSKRIIKVAWISMTLVLFLGASAGAFEEPYEELLRDLEKQGQPVFVVSCYIIDPDYENEKLGYSLIFPMEKTKTLQDYLGTQPGILIQKNENGTVVNMATLSYSKEDSTLYVSEAQGGVWTYKKLGEVANTMSKNKFFLITSLQIRKSLHTFPDQRCP